MSHTKEPWAADQYGQITDGEGKPIIGHPHNARRIVACVNACDGIDTVQLDMLDFTAVLASLNAAREQRDELLAALKACESALRFVESETGRTYAATVNARAVIAKAEAA